MSSVVVLSTARESLPKEFMHDDNRFPESFVMWALKNYSKKGAVVFDPFAGLGTTLFVAEKLGRKGYGIEIDPKRVAYVKEKIKNPDRIVEGDSRTLGQYSFPKIDLCLTSPVYMQKNFKRNPLRGNKKGSYAQYLDDTRSIFTKLKKHLKKNARVLVEVSNLKNYSGITPLAWDICKKLSTIFAFKGEIIIKWEGKRSKQGTYGYGYDHSYILVFKNK